MGDLKKKRGKRASLAKTILFIVLGCGILSLVVAYLLKGQNVALLQPKGLIAGEQLNLMIAALALMSVIAVPAISILYFTVWKYRDTNDKAAYEPTAKHSKLFVGFLWIIPCITALFIGLLLWPATHRLEPKKTIENGVEPIKIQVVALRWKWVFIYPEQNIATVNYIQIPSDTPIQFDLTADETPMTSFWIPNLAGQLYAMTGHSNRLNILADTDGDYIGSTAEINGAGFAGMRFTTRVSSVEDFDKWVQDIQQSQNVLSEAEYKKLLKPSENAPEAFFSSVDTNLYDNILKKYAGSHEHQVEQYNGHEGGH